MKTTAYVCVHGIGTHTSGALVDGALAAVRCGAEDLGGRIVELPLSPDSPRELIRRGIVEAPGHEPFIAEFYDGWWARRVPRPRFWSVLRWGLRIAPLVLLNTAWLWFADRISEAQRSSLFSWAVAALPAGLFLVLAPVAVVLLPVLLAVAATVGRWRQKVQMIIVDIIGDAWLYRSKELDQTVLPQLKRLAVVAGQRADHVVMVGHSQGAELTRRIGLRLARLRRRGAEDVADFRFVWVGSGENQLNTVRALARTRWLPLVLWPYLLIWPALHYPAAQLLIDDLVRMGEMLMAAEFAAASLSAARAVGLIGLLVVFVTAGMVFTKVLARPARDAGRLPPGPSWYVQSILDPVSFGSAAVRARAETTQQVSVRYVPIQRSQPWWLEHTSYFGKPQTGHVLISAGLPDPVPLSPRRRPQVPVSLLLLSAAAVFAVLAGGYLVGRWQWALLG